MSQLNAVVNINLQNYLRDKEPLAIALSGGIDSSTLTLFCHQNQIEYAGFTITGPHVTDFEIQRVIRLRNEYGLNHIFFYYDYRYYSNVIKNPHDRCFHCKSSLLTGPANFFSSTHTLADGSNYTDTLGHRPGIRALKNLGIISPFVDLKIDKSEIVEMARRLGLKAEEKDSRSCILARFDYGIFLDDNLVLKIRKAEDYLLQQGLTGFRLRVLSPEKCLLQINSQNEPLFKQIQPGFDTLTKQIDLFPYEVDFLPFSKITGYYDQF